MADEYPLVEPDEAESPGDEWDELDVSDTEADRIARQRDREFAEFRERLTDADQFKLEESVFDEATYAAIYKLVQDGYIEAFGGPISTGKEANVYEALGGEGEDVAVKIYRTNAADFRHMREYLAGDPRFEGLGGDRKAVVLAWVRKEFANLKRARQAGVRVPEPIAAQRNVLVMEYLGDESGPAPTLHDVRVENPETAYRVVREYMRRLYDAGLVHGDLSEYNVVVYDGHLVLIDVGQAVTVHHPNAGEFLERDCRNVANFFAGLGVDVTGADLEAYLHEHAEPGDGDDGRGDGGGPTEGGEAEGRDEGGTTDERRGEGGTADAGRDEGGTADVGGGNGEIAEAGGDGGGTADGDGGGTADGDGPDG